ncbi:ABC transporter ATP-binding protein [Thermodesulfobacteriota bacterium]
MPIVKVDTVTKTFGPYEAVSQVSFSVQKGTILGLVGSDGAGKTTLLRMIATMLKPSSGKIFIKGLNVVSQKTRVKPLIGYMPQRFGLYQDLTVDENLNFFLDIFGITGKERKSRKDHYLRFSNLHPFIDRLARDLSGGMKQKLGLACVLVHQPDVLILDEPTNGVDPVSRQEFWEILANMRREKMTILVSTAYLDEGEKCDRLLLMHNAHVLEEASPQDFRSNFPDLEKAMIDRIQAADKALADDRFNP